MIIAILESEIDTLDRMLEALSSSGHICFGVESDERLWQMLNDISVELFLIDWTHPDAVRYDTLARLVQHATGAPVVLCITPHTSHSVIDSGMRCGASLAVEKPSSGADSFHISLSSLH